MSSHSNQFISVQKKSSLSKMAEASGEASGEIYCDACRGGGDIIIARIGISDRFSTALNRPDVACKVWCNPWRARG